MSVKWLTEPESLVLLSMLQYGMMSNEASESVSGIQNNRKLGVDLSARRNE